MAAGLGTLRWRSIVNFVVRFASLPSSEEYAVECGNPPEVTGVALLNLPEAWLLNSALLLAYGAL
jgi:hypothetical protein